MLLYIVAFASFFLLATQFTWAIYRYKSYAAAPGPILARFTRLWYAWQIWLGEWEKVDIALHKQHGKVIRIAPNMYSIDDPTAIKPLYGINSNMVKSSWYRAFGQPGVPDHNLFSAIDRTFHAGMRRKMAGFYSMTAVKSYESSVNSTIETLFQQFDRFGKENRWFNLQHWMQCYAFDTVGAVTYGYQFGFMNSGGEDIDNLMGNIERALWFNSITGLIKRLKWLLQPIIVAINIPIFSKIAKYDRLAELKYMSFKDNLIDEDIESEDENKPATFWDKVQKQKEKNITDYMKYRMWVSQTQNVAAGSDTTSIALTSFLYHSMKNPTVWHKLMEELDAAVNDGEVSDPISFEQAQKLKYLQYTIKESMRIHPSAGLPYWRVVNAPGLEVAGKFFPTGTWVGINPYVAHHNREIFGHDADVFNPDRWDPVTTPKEKLEAMEAYWLPFGSGSRTCIGKNVALLEMNKLLPELLKRYTFELDASASENLKSENNWFVKQKNVMVRIVRRSL